MKAVAITSLALVASVQAAGWKDADPAKSTTTTAASSTWADVSISKTTTTTKPVSEETQSYWGDEEVVESTTTCEYDPEETVWSDAPVVVTETVWSDAPAPSKPVQGGKGDPEHVWSDAGDKWTTTTATGTVTETKWIDVAPSKPADPSYVWSDAPAVPSSVSPASSSSWADYVAATPAADSCVVSVITKYGKPTWTPDAAVPATWVDASIPASETSVPATWVDAAVPSSAIPSSSVPATWADSPAPSDPAVWADCGVPKTVTEEVTITYTVTDGHWSDVAIVTSSDPVAEHTWSDVVVVTSTDPVADHTWADIPAEPTKSTTGKPVHGGHGKPSTTTTTTKPAVETEKTWSDVVISTTTTTPSKPTTWTKPSKPSDPPTTTKPTSGEETQAYWGDAQ